MNNTKTLIIQEHPLDLNDISSDVSKIMFGSIYSFKDIIEINNIIEYLKQKNIKAKIMCELPLYSLNKDWLIQIADKDMVCFYTKEKEFSIDDMLAIDKLLDLIVSDIKNSNMSLYEKYIAIYYIVIHFKQYNDYKKDPVESRSIYTILSNDYIVCSGYGTLLCDLLNRVGIGAKSVSVIMDSVPHDRTMVRIDDDKYNIHGFFFCDPTQDEFNARNKSFFKLARNMNNTLEEHSKDLTVDDLITEGLFVSMTNEELYSYMKSRTIFFLQIAELMKFDQDFIREVGPLRIDYDYAVKLNEYIKRKMNNKISLITQYKALMEVMQFTDNKRYSREEYQSKLDEITKGDMRLVLEVAKSSLLSHNSTPAPDYNKHDYNNGSDNSDTLINKNKY